MRTNEKHRKSKLEFEDNFTCLLSRVLNRHASHSFPAVLSCRIESSITQNPDSPRFDHRPPSKSTSGLMRSRVDDSVPKRGVGFKRQEARTGDRACGDKGIEVQELCQISTLFQL